MTFYKKGYPFLFISGYPGIRDFFNALATAREFTTLFLKVFYCPVDFAFGNFFFAPQRVAALA